MEFTIAERDFTRLRTLLHDLVGINLSSEKKPLVASRLARRLKQYQLDDLGSYLERLRSDPAELQTAVDLLTTNETYFFREPKHFDFLRAHVLPTARPGRTFRVWSAACSSGEEPYTLAMVLAEALGKVSWEILATDISTRVLETARAGIYPMERAKNIPPQFLTNHCLKGVRSQEGTFKIDRPLRERVTFRHLNLNTRLPSLGEFDLIFLRNVMIYFDAKTKQRIVEQILATLRSGGHLVIGHSESLNGITEAVRMIQPSVYLKP